MAARRKERGKGPPKKGVLTVFILFFSVTGQGSSKMHLIKSPTEVLIFFEDLFNRNDFYFSGEGKRAKKKK